MCKHSDCAESILARDEIDHYKYECESKYVVTRYEMIGRARKNRGYARPWGVDVLKDAEFCSTIDVSSSSEEQGGAVATPAPTTTTTATAAAIGSIVE